MSQDDGIKAGQRFGADDPEMAERFLKVQDDWFVLPRLSDGFQQNNKSRWYALILRGKLQRNDHSCPGAHSDADVEMNAFFEKYGINEETCAEEFCVGIKDSLLIGE